MPYRPSWWKDKADASIVGSAEEIWGQAFIRSMQSGNNSTSKIPSPSHRIPFKNQITPAVHNSMAQRRRRRDTRPLAQLSVKFSEKKPTALICRGIKSPMICYPKSKKNHLLFHCQRPALSPILMSSSHRPCKQYPNHLNHPENSKPPLTNGHPPLLKQDNTDSGLRLVVGYSRGGGARYVYGYHRGVRGTATASASRSCSKNTDLWGLILFI